MLRLFVILLFVSACTTFQFSKDFTYKEIETKNFNLASWQKISLPKDAYKIYIEGDGHAFNSHGYPTNDPTPHSDLVRRLAMKDRSPNVVYLARPCQYLKGKKCSQKYWTTARFASEVVEAEYQAIKEIVKESPVVLIGFSGGGQIAGLLATTTDLKVQKIITIAGNLDHKAWSKYHRLPSLSESLNLADYKVQFEKIPQFHYVGAKDKVVPPNLTEKFIEDRSLIYVMPKAAHNDGWDTLELN